MSDQNGHRSDLSRSAAIGRTLAAAGVTGGTLAGVRAQREEKRGVKNGRINQSVVFWCFNVAGGKWDIEKDLPGDQGTRLNLGCNFDLPREA